MIDEGCKGCVFKIEGFSSSPFCTKFDCVEHSEHRVMRFEVRDKEGGSNEIPTNV